MRDRRDLVAAFDALGTRGESAVLATVVAVSGSTYRRPGARALFFADGSTLGLISGGCLEGDLGERAARVRTRGVAERVRYDSTEDEDLVWGLGLGCAGVVDVLLQRVSAQEPGPFPALARSLDAVAPLAIATVVGPADATAELGRSETAADDDARRARAAGHALVVEHGNRSLLVELLEPLPALYVFGAGPDAAPVVRLATGVGFEVTVIDPRPAFAQPERFPEASRVLMCRPEETAAKLEPGPNDMALLMTHHYHHDRGYLAFLLTTPIPFIGALGPRRRTEDLLAELAREGRPLDEARLTVLHAPAGLDLGAEGPDEIAVSLVAELLATRAGRTGAPLRDRPGPIHEPEGS